MNDVAGVWQEVPPPAAGSTVRVSCWVAVCAGLPESVACTVNVEVPAVVGVPEMVPSLASDSPAGSDPEVTDQLYGLVPPEADRSWLYALPTVASGRLDVVIDGAT